MCKTSQSYKHLKEDDDSVANFKNRKEKWRAA